ncbi:MAG: alpha/beta fold hydrolase [Nocardioidaceae bacterium]
MTIDAVPRLRGGRRNAESAALVLHGGSENGLSVTSPTQLSYLRMVDLYAGLRHRSRHCAVYLLRYRVRGWNPSRHEPDPVIDARWALDRIADRHNGAPVVLLGHSMGGRTAFAVADHPQVQGVVGLAPWLPDNEPAPAVGAGQQFVIAHGTGDAMTSAPLSERYARRLRAAGGAVARFELSGGHHAMLERPVLWHRFAVATTLGLAGDQPMPVGVAKGLASEDPATLRLSLDQFDVDLVSTGRIDGG